MFQFASRKAFTSLAQSKTRKSKNLVSDLSTLLTLENSVLSSGMPIDELGEYNKAR